MDALDVRPQKLAWATALAGTALLIGSLWISAVSGAAAYAPPILASAAIMLLSAISAGRMMFARRETIETENLRVYRREHPESELFEDSDEAVRLAARANRTYSTYAVPVLCVITGAALVVASLLIWRWTNTRPMPAAVGWLQHSVFAFGFAVLALLAGSYLVGCSRTRAYRWLRPSGAWLFFLAALYLLAGVVLLCVQMNIATVVLDQFAGKLGLAMVMVLGAELVLDVIVEFYRPRHVGEEPRPVFESRLLGLFTEPGGIARNVAASLDYQFGFRISEARFYRFIERGVMPFLAIMLGAFWLMTCFQVIDPEENGIRERFGRAVSPRDRPLGPGLYFKLPWPFARIMTFPVAHVQEMPIGYTPADADDPHDMPPAPGVEMGDVTGRVIVWSKMHHREEVDFVVASDPARMDIGVGDETLRAGGKVPVSVYFAAASVPVYFKVNNLYNYAYRHHDARETLKRLALRELVAYLASVDLFDILTEGRAAGGRILRERVQAAADHAELGVDIVFIGLQGLHPPVTVGQAFDNVVSAMEQKHTIILEAETYAVGQVPDARGKADALVADARAYTYNRERLGKAEAARFDHQVRAFEAAPEMFVLRSFLDVLERETNAIRKYIVGTPRGREVIILDLQQKLRPDLLDIDLDREY